MSPVKLQIIKGTLFQCFMILCIHADGQQGQTSYQHANTEIYNKFRSYGENVPVPKQLDTIDLGSFNNQSGIFEGFGSKLPVVKDNSERLNTVIYPKVIVHALETVYKINLSGNTSETTLSINENSEIVNGQNVVFCKGPSNGLVSWEISSSGKRFANKLQVTRIPLIAIGAFTLDHLLAAIVYHPPPGEQKLNFAFYANKKSVNSVVSITKQSEESKTTPSIIDFQGLENSMKTIVQLGKAVKLNEEPGSALSSGIDFLSKNIELLGALADAIGDFSATQTVGSVTEEGLELKTSEINEFTLSTQGSQSEQGLADRFYFLLKPRFLWVYNDGKLEISFLDFDGTLNIPGHQIRDEQRFQEVSKLNPFLLRRNLNQNRYQHLDRISLSDGTETYKIERGNSQLYTSNSTTFKTEVVDFKPGFLGKILGAETSTIVTKLSQSRSVSQMSAEDILCEVTLVATQNERITVDIFYDKLYGTLAFQYVMKNSVNENSNPSNNDIDGESSTVIAPGKPSNNSRKPVLQLPNAGKKSQTKPAGKASNILLPKSKSTTIIKPKKTSK